MIASTALRTERKERRHASTYAENREKKRKEHRKYLAENERKERSTAQVPRENREKIKEQIASTAENREKKGVPAQVPRERKKEYRKYRAENREAELYFGGAMLLQNAIEKETGRDYKNDARNSDKEKALPTYERRLHSQNWQRQSRNSTRLNA